MSGRMGTDSRFLETLFSAGTTCGLSDAQLVERFVARHDETAESAFESLVLRHGPMVFDIGLKILGNRHDAQDAFQAAFLILATKARLIMRQSSVGSWLHGVALRVARRARSDAAKRKVHERQIAAMTNWEAEPNSGENHDGFEVLHEEVERLPRKYREAVVLSYLEGLSLDAAAGQLGCPIGTIGVRLMRARKRLKVRLGRRGMTAPAGLLVAGSAVRSAFAALPPALVGSTVNAVIARTTNGISSLAAGKLTSNVLRSMMMIKLAKALTVVMVILAAIGSFGGMLVHSGKLVAREPSDEKPVKAPNPWIGKTVVTKYGAPVRGVVEEPVANRISRLYVVRERNGTQVRLEYGGDSGWIEASDVLLLDGADDFYSREIRAKPTSAYGYFQRGVIWTYKGENDKAIADYTKVILIDPQHAWAHAKRAYDWGKKNEWDKAIDDLLSPPN